MEDATYGVELSENIGSETLETKRFKPTKDASKYVEKKEIPIHSIINPLTAIDTFWHYHIFASKTPSTCTCMFGSVACINAVPFNTFLSLSFHLLHPPLPISFSLSLSHSVSHPGTRRSSLLSASLAATQKKRSTPPHCLPTLSSG